MTKFKIPAILLLAVALIVLGGFLPKLAARWQDSADSTVTGYAALSDVQLEFGDSNRPMGIRDKLALLKDYTDSMELPESLAGLTLNDVTSIVQNTIRRYQAAGLIPAEASVTPRQLSAAPYLVSWSKDTEQGNIFWNVNIDLDSEYRYHLFLIIDDQTETVCIVDFTDNEAELEEKDMTGMMSAFCQTYLTGFSEALSQYDPAAVARDAYFVGAENDTLLAELEWSDILYGHVALNFYVTKSKFYVALS